MQSILPSDPSEWTVVVHTYNRPDYLERDAVHGRWDGAPVLLIDDGSPQPIQRRLEEVSSKISARLVLRKENSGVAVAAKEGVEACATDHVMLCGDDDYYLDLSSFSGWATRALKNPDVLLAVMPEIIALDPSGKRKLQYDRRCYDGMTGRELLRELTQSGEMRALQAGSMMRRADILPHFAEPAFRTSEDFVLLVRLCAAFPDARVQVAPSGAYVRRVHEASLSHASKNGVDRVTQNLLGTVIASLLLEHIDGASRSETIGTLRQRAHIVTSVYGLGLGIARVLESSLLGRSHDPASQEEVEAVQYMLTHGLPKEMEHLRSLIVQQEAGSVGQGPSEIASAASILLDEGRVEEAEDLLSSCDKPNHPDVMGVRARASWAAGDAQNAARLIGDALVNQPDHAGNLFLFSQVAAAAGADSEHRRLVSRLAQLIGPEGAQELGIEFEEHPEDIRVAFVVKEGLDQFLDDVMRELIPHLNVRKFVVKGSSDVDEALAWADVCWFEWCNEPLIYATHQDITREKAIVCRLHRYEAFSGLPQKVKWDRVDTLVVVAEHLGMLVSELIPGLASKTQLVHIPNGVTLGDFEFSERAPGFDIALAGYLHGRKNPSLALQIISALVRKDARYKLHVAGRFQDPVVKLYWEHAVIAMGLQDHVIMHGWQQNMAEFLADKSYLLSASMHESFGYTIAEAMAAGIKPIVHNFPFAGDIWPREILFDTVEEAVSMIRAPEVHSGAYRQFIADHYSLEAQAEETEKILRSAAKRLHRKLHPEEIVDVIRIEPQAANAQLTVRCPACHGETLFQQQSVAGVPVGMNPCTECGTMLQIAPDRYLDTLAAFEQSVLIGDPFVQTTAIRQIAMHWAERPAWRTAMTYEGVNLGACMAFDLTPQLVTGWLAAHKNDLAA